MCRTSCGGFANLEIGYRRDVDGVYVEQGSPLPNCITFGTSVHTHKPTLYARASGGLPVPAFREIALSGCTLRAMAF